jgi:hypothetical protein
MFFLFVFVLSMLWQTDLIDNMAKACSFLAVKAEIHVCLPTSCEVPGSSR